MNRTISDKAVGAAALAAALAVSACAGAKPAPAAAKPASAAPVAVEAKAAPVAADAPIAMPAGPLTRVGGVVVSADPAARSLTIKDYHGATRVFRFAGDAAVTKGGDEAPVGLDGISAGDRVRLKVGGDVIASAHVMVNPAQ